MSKLFNEGTIINVGLRSFAEAVALAGGKAQHLEWTPPAAGDREIGLALARLVQDPVADAATQRSYQQYLQSQPVLIGVGLAGKELPGMEGRMLLHAGPPIDWSDMCGPMQGAIIGAILYEGWATSGEGARDLAGSGKVAFAPCHHHGAVGPMAGVISPSMPVWIVENANGGNRAYSNMNEGLGRVLRFGANDKEVIDRLHWIADTLAPVLKAGLAKLGPVEMKPLIAQALHMGDECHNRNAAASSLLFKRFAPAALGSAVPQAQLRECLLFLAGNDHFFLNLSMATCKAMLDAAHGVRGSSLVTAMARNGVRFGIRVSGTGDAWFQADALPVDGLYFPGYGPEDAAKDLGDSAITETAGIGGFAMAAAPAIVQFVGGTPNDAIANTVSMTYVTVGRNNAFTLPALNFSGTPAGIDARRVLDTNIKPIINTGIAHKEAGVGQIGAGITRAPLDCFAQAIKALAAEIA
ncbi:MAG TPA: DUF1116 domain-containing protein [Xanthobacteraceae bacterium]|nr:DUF1116 domain-containing protein [Xanthobacteraceae bacterium]